ncbi:hypothetical protein BFJ69_g15519 [Fusarium oxysporum]|uniref:Extracellular metalloproteinase n=1 Tax=Fusarium oxysporum TaxID=5507 RepID=A0A420ME01_FUSOX|nr:hypothetical protein BFJ69_g15519 [Fusarium oxysporum]
MDCKLIIQEPSKFNYDLKRILTFCPLSRKMCHFVPEYVLQRIAGSEAVPDEARQAARDTLSTDGNFRGQRERAPTGGRAVNIPAASIPAAQAPIITALVGPAARDEPSGSATVDLALRRAIYDGRHNSRLPGTLARSEGTRRIFDRQVNNAFDGVGITVKFFYTVFGRNAIDNNGGTPVVTFVFGDGDGITFDYFADSLDVVAHELTHAITQYIAGIPYNGQAGGLNESISDIFAALVEQWHFTQTAADADWLTGQNLFPIAFKGAALRNIANPGTAYNDPILGRDPQIDHFSNYDDSLDVHITSGIPNRAFYLIAIGFGGYAWLKAGRIWYETLRDTRIREFGQNITFRDWATVTVDQANRLFDASATTIVRNAWVSVGVL